MAKLMAKPKPKNQSLKSFNHSGTLNDTVKRLGTVLINVLIAELIEAAIERVMQKMVHSDESDQTNGSHDKAMVAEDRGERSRLKSATVSLQDKWDSASPAMRDAIDAVRVAIREITPDWTEVTQLLQELTQQSWTPSPEAAPRTDQVMDNATGAMRTVMDNFRASDDRPVAKKRKSKKKAKKSA